MSLKPIIEKLEDAPTAFQSAYVEDADLGKFVLDVAKYDAIATVGLKEKAQRLTESANTLSGKLKRYERFSELPDEELDELLTLREAKAQGKLNADEAAAKYQQQLRDERAKLEKQWSEKLTAKEQEAAQITQKFTNRVRHAELLKLAAAHGVKPHMADHLAKLVASRFRVTDVERGTLELLEDDGETVSIHSPADAFKTIFKEGEYAGFYEASDKGGSGASPNPGGAGRKRTMRRADWEKLSPAESTRFFSEGGEIVD